MIKQDDKLHEGKFSEVAEGKVTTEGASIQFNYTGDGIQFEIKGRLKKIGHLERTLIAILKQYDLR